MSKDKAKQDAYKYIMNEDRKRSGIFGINPLKESDKFKEVINKGLDIAIKQAKKELLDYIEKNYPAMLDEWWDEWEEIKKSI